MAISEKAKQDCFLIMPISDPEGYLKGHFKHVYEDILSPACDRAGFHAVRADDVRQTNLIHLDVLQRLIEAPMAICDLSSRNPNVLFELGLRQAFDKSVVLVREIGTPEIFDITPLRFTEYRKERIYHEVLEDQENISRAIVATDEAAVNGQGINSIVKLLSLTKPASLVDVQEADKDPVLQIIRSELSDLRSEFRSSLRRRDSALLANLRRASIQANAKPNKPIADNAFREFNRELDFLEQMIDVFEKRGEGADRILQMISVLEAVVKGNESTDEDAAILWFELKLRLKRLHLRFRDVERSPATTNDDL